ncbi:MAG: hypothetical protein ACYDH2_11485, partial [Anaerolineaceae bacterium]
IVRDYKKGLDDEMKEALSDFIESSNGKALYYKTVRMISYPQPPWWVKLITKRRLSTFIKGSSLEVVKQILLNELIKNATRGAGKKPSDFSREHVYYSSFRSKCKKKYFQFVKLAVKKLETFVESWRRKKL